MASGGSSTGPEKPCKSICLNVGLTDTPIRQKFTQREEHLKTQFDKFSMVAPDLIMLQEVNDFWMPFVEKFATQLFPRCIIKRYAENSTVVILCGKGWDQSSPDRIVGGELKCFGDTSDEKKRNVKPSWWKPRSAGKKFAS